MEKISRTFNFACTQNGAKARVTWRRFENATFRACINVIMTSKITFATVPYIYDDVKCCDGPGILYVKFHSHVLTARELPC